MQKPKVLLPYKSRQDFADDTAEWKRMEELVEFVKYQLTSEEDFKRYLPDSDISALWITEDLFIYAGGPAKYIDFFPRSLRTIVVPWVGTDFIDGSKLRGEKDIVLCNIGPNAAENVADLALYLTLSCFRMTSFWEHSFRFVNGGKVGPCREYIGGKKNSVIKGAALDPETGNLEIQEHVFPERLSHEQAEKVNFAKDFTLAGKTVESPTGKNALVLGFGAIGQTIGKKLHYGLGMNIHYYKRSGPLPKEYLGYPACYHGSLVDRETWGVIDLIVMALPGNNSTENLLNKEVLNMCKEGVRVVNVGRGSCVDEDALLEALDSGKVSSAGLDVFKDEQTGIDERFLKRWDVTLLPHIGSAVADIIKRQTIITLQNLESVLIKGEGGIYPVN